MFFAEGIDSADDLSFVHALSAIELF